MRKSLVVLGMHRSGTSAVTGVLDALGVGGPRSMMPPDAANPRGYFESARLFSVLDQLLAAAGSAWDDWRQFEPQWFDSQAAQQHRGAVKARLIEDSGDQPLIYIKDPRICRFFPFVSSLLAEIGISPVAVLPLRNPLEVASSLQHRDQFAPAKSILLWLRHQLDAEFYSRGIPRCFVSYDDLLLDWRSQMNRMAEQIGLTWPDNSDRSRAAIDQFLSVELHRHRASLADFKNDPLVVPLARDSYEILLDIVARGESGALFDRLDRIRTNFDEGCRTFGPAIAEAVPAYNRVIGELDKVAAACSRLTAERDALVGSNHDLIAERDTLAAQCSDLRAERDAVIAATIGS